MGLLVDPIPNSRVNTIRIVWQTVRRIINEILGVKGLITHKNYPLYQEAKKCCFAVTRSNFTHIWKMLGVNSYKVYHSKHAD